MQDVRRILHPTDFSKTAQTALRVGVRIAYHADAELRLLHVVRSRSEQGRIEPRMPRIGDVMARMRAAVRHALNELPQDAEDRLSIEYAMDEDVSVAEAIFRSAKESNADLVVMGTHGRRGVRRFILGSVAARVLHEATCDVITVPRMADTTLEGRILLPVDLFGRSRETVEVGVRLASRLGTGIDLLYVIDTSLLFMPSVESQIPAKIDSIEDVARKRLLELADTVKPDVDIRIHVTDGHPAHEILEFAGANRVGLMMMASSGMTPDERLLLEPQTGAQPVERTWMLGSITERVATHAGVPVWVRKKFANGRATVQEGVEELELTAS